MANMGVGYGGISKDTSDLRLTPEQLEAKRVEEKTKLDAAKKAAPLPIAPPKDEATPPGVGIEKNPNPTPPKTHSMKPGITDGKGVALKPKEVADPTKEAPEVAPAPKAEAAPKSKEPEGKIHTVVKGDTVSQVVAKEYIDSDGKAIDLSNNAGKLDSLHLAEAVVAQKQNSAIADKNKTHHIKHTASPEGHRGADFIEQAKGKKKADQIFLPDEVKVGDKTYRRIGAPPKETPKAVEATPAKVESKVKGTAPHAPNPVYNGDPTKLQGNQLERYNRFVGYQEQKQHERPKDNYSSHDHSVAAQDSRARIAAWDKAHAKGATESAAKPEATPAKTAAVAQPEVTSATVDTTPVVAKAAPAPETKVSAEPAPAAKPHKHHSRKPAAEPKESSSGTDPFAFIRKPKDSTPKDTGAADDGFSSYYDKYVAQLFSTTPKPVTPKSAAQKPKAAGPDDASLKDLTDSLAQLLNNSGWQFKPKKQ